MITAFECKLSYMATLSERMKLALSDAGMNQSELARIVGVSHPKPASCGLFCVYPIN